MKKCGVWEGIESPKKAKHVFHVQYKSTSLGFLKVTNDMKYLSFGKQ